MHTKNAYLTIDIALRDWFGSNNTALVFQRCLYWGGILREGFYKFKLPCKKHPLYKKGDSWCEELGLSRKILDPIFSRLINHHKTKGEYLKAKDKFKGKMIASYTNRKTSQTFYFINWQAVDQFLTSLSIKKKTPKISSAKAFDTPKPEPKTLSKGHHCDAPLGHHFVRTHPDLCILQTNTPLDGKASKEVLKKETQEDKVISKKMVEKWNTLMNDKVVWYPSCAQRLSKVLKDSFKGSLEVFNRYCLTIASADFLTGKAKNSKFKAFLFWALKPEVIESILAGAYGVKNFFSLETPEEKTLKDHIKQLDNQIKAIDFKISKHQEEITEGQKMLVEELKQSLTPEELGVLRQESDRECLQKNPQHLEIEDNYSASLLNIHFEGPEGFLKRKLKERLGLSQTILPPQKLIDQKNLLLQERDKKCQEYKKVGKSKKNLKSLIFKKQTPSPALNQTQDCFWEDTRADEDVDLQPTIHPLPPSLPADLSPSLTEIKRNQEVDVLEQKAAPAQNEPSSPREGKALIAQLKKEIPPHQFPSWLSEIHVEAINPHGILVVSLRDDMSVTWCQEQFATPILTCAQRVWKDVRGLRVINNPAPELNHGEKAEIEAVPQDLAEEKAEIRKADNDEQAGMALLNLCANPSKGRAARMLTLGNILASHMTG